MGRVGKKLRRMMGEKGGMIIVEKNSGCVIQGRRERGNAATERRGIVWCRCGDDG